MRRAEPRNNLLGTCNEHLEVRIGLKRGLDAGKHNLGLLVASDGINTHANLIHVVPPDREMADSRSRP